MEKIDGKTLKHALTCKLVNHPPQSSEQIPILGVPISAMNIPLALAAVRQWVSQQKSAFVCFREVNGLMDAQGDPGLKSLHYSAGLVMPDGKPIAWLCRLKGHSEVRQVCGRD